MNKNRIPFTSTLMLAGLLLSGCAGLDVNNMVPDTSSLAVPKIDKSISVTNVGGAQDARFAGPAMVSDEQFKSSLVEALQKSGIFRSVVTDSGADLEISAEFVAQGQGAGLNYLAALVVEYMIIDSASQDEVWSDTFNSRHEVTVSQALSGAKRTVMAAEGAVRENLEQLLENLAEADLE